ncbi:MAG TPA: cell division protein FtsZ [Candidatus Limnocylindrales bacterium]|nr:cell division protein FtsZ [Candidatus Limnocylindrales bacterium]
MDWLLQYWPYLLAILLIGLLAVRLVTMLPRFRQPTRHSGERVIRVIGVGGAGGNAINHMIRAKQRGVEYVAVNTDAQVLDESLAMRRVQIGAQLTQGLGAGGDATIGREAAVEDEDELGRMVAGSDLVFIAAGLGGGTGSGAAPVIAKKAREAGALTVGVVTKPFTFEGAGRWKVADEAEAELKAHVDTLLLIQNEKVMGMIGEDTSMLEAFRVVNEVLARTVRAIVDVMTVPGLINLDFADVRTVMRDGGTATTGIGWASGPDRAVEAARAAVNNPLLDHDISGAGAILLNVAGASTMSMREVTRAADEIRNVADPQASIIFGTIFDDHLGDELRVTVIATRFSDRTLERPAAVAMPVAVAAETPIVPEPVAAVAETPIVQEPITPEPAEPGPVAPPVLEEQQPIAAAAAMAPVASWQEPAVEPDMAPEPEAVGYEAQELSAEPVGFHVAADDEPEPVTPWYAGSAEAHPETLETQVASKPMSSSVATVLAALAEERPAPAYVEDEEPAPNPTYFAQQETPTPAFEPYEQPSAAVEQQEGPTHEQDEAPAPAFEPYERPTASYEEPSAAVAEQEAPTPSYYEAPAQPEAPEPVEESPALPQGLAEILRDEPEQVTAQLPEPEASAPPAPAPGPSPVAPRPSPAQPGPPRQEPVRTPTSALVGRFWSRIGKSQR